MSTFHPGLLLDVDRPGTLNVQPVLPAVEEGDFGFDDLEQAIGSEWISGGQLGAIDNLDLLLRYSTPVASLPRSVPIPFSAAADVHILGTTLSAVTDRTQTWRAINERSIPVWGSTPLGVSGHTRVVRGKTSPSGPPSFSDLIDLAVAEMGRLKPNWDGEGGIVPSEQTVNTLQVIPRAVPLRTRPPEIEVDGSDGSVSLRWYSTNGSAVFSMTVRGQEIVGVLTSTLQEPVSWRLGGEDDAKLARQTSEIALLTDADL